MSWSIAKLRDLVKLASDHEMTTYEASYLLLARDRGLTLATFAAVIHFARVRIVIE